MRVWTGVNVFFFSSLRSSRCCFVLLQVTFPTLMPSKHTRLGKRMQGRNGDRLGQAAGREGQAGSGHGGPSGAIWATALMPASRSHRPAAHAQPGSGVPALPVSIKHPHPTTETKKVIARLFSSAMLSDL